jgi:hypothetical protein
MSLSSLLSGSGWGNLARSARMLEAHRRIALHVAILITATKTNEGPGLHIAASRRRGCEPTTVLRLARP